MYRYSCLCTHQEGVLEDWWGISAHSYPQLDSADALSLWKSSRYTLTGRRVGPGARVDMMQRQDQPLALTGIRTPLSSTRDQSLYLLSYPGSIINYILAKWMNHEAKNVLACCIFNIFLFPTYFVLLWDYLQVDWFGKHTCTFIPTFVSVWGTVLVRTPLCRIL